MTEPATNASAGGARSVRTRLAFGSGVLTGALVLAALLATALGPAGIPVRASGAIVLHRLGVPTTGFSRTEQQIVEQIRLPRIVAACLVGAALASAGVVLQGVFRNPLADPGIIGVSSGAALGAVLAIAAGLAARQALALPAAAFVGAVLAGLAVVAIAMPGSREPVTTLVLAGIAVSAFCSAGTSAIISFSDDRDRLREMVFWLFGGLDNRSWAHVGMLLGPLAIGLAAAFVFARDLNLFALSDEEARSLGVATDRVRLALLAASALLTAGAVAVSGTIAFVGLIVPHVLRLAVGPEHRVLLPLSALGGALFLLVADTIARLLVQPTEVRVGIVTSFLGAPFFLFLLHRHRQKVYGL